MVLLYKTLNSATAHVFRGKKNMNEKNLSERI